MTQSPGRTRADSQSDPITRRRRSRRARHTHRTHFGPARPDPFSSTGYAPRWRARRSLSLGLVAVLAVPLIGASKSAAVTVDGDTRQVRTYAATVGELLSDLDVAVGPADAVRPPRSTPLEAGDNIRVVRAIAVDLVVDGAAPRRIVAPVSSVAGVLRVAGLASVRETGAAISPGVHAPVADGDTITVRTPQDFTIAVDGRTAEGASLASTVGLLLAEQGIEVDGDDLVRPAPGTAVDGPTGVAITRVRVTEEVEEVTLEHDEQTRETGDLYTGESRVAREGADGLREDSYEVTFHDGEEVGRARIGRAVVREPVAQIVEVGTRSRPAPPPARSSSASSSSTSSAPAVASGSVWDQLAQCESGGNWGINSGNGYYGGLQFSLGTWQAVGGSGYPHEHSRAEQIERGNILQQRSGWGQWPHCSSQLGLR